jgi:hypothetical protein
VTCIVNEQARVTAEQFERSVHWRAEFLQWFALEICRYNNSIHSSLGCSPVAKWEELAGEMSGDIPFDMEAFRVSFLPSEQRQVRRDGIHLFDLRYWSDALAGYVGRRDGKVVVRYDPRDLGLRMIMIDEVHNLLAGRRLCSALASMGTQELPCFVRLKRNPAFLPQLTGSYCETGKDSDEPASECHV